MGDVMGMCCWMGSQFTTGLTMKITQTAVINIVFQRIFIKLDVSYASQHTFSKYETSSFIKMLWNIMFITAVCVIFLIKLRWPKNKSLWIDYNGVTFLVELLEWGRTFSGFLG